MESHCIICDETVSESDNAPVLTEKGAKSLNAAAHERGDILNARSGKSVHVGCRRDYCDKKRIACFKKKNIPNTGEPESVRLLRSASTASVDSNNNCLFCGEDVSFEFDARYNAAGNAEGVKVRTYDFQSSVTQMCNERNDAWSKIVLGRINSIIADLHAADTVYHRSCSVNFRTGKDIPKRYSKTSDASTSSTKRRRTGRPPDEVRMEAFDEATKYFETNDEEQITVRMIYDKMQELLIPSDIEPYSTKHIKRMIIDRYGDNVIITDTQGKEDVITFRETAKSILHNYYKLPKNEDAEQERINLIHALGKILVNEIKVVSTPKDKYHGLDDLTVEASLEFVPPSLRLLLSCILPKEHSTLIVAALGQAIMQAARPRALMAPMQIGLALQMHHHFGSRFLIDTLSNMGFSSSYNEVLKFEKSAAVTHGKPIESVVCGGIIQFIADNVDHDICTIDGRGTFHGMGIIAAVTPAQKTKRYTIPRLEVSANLLKEVGKIAFHLYSKPRENTVLSYKEFPTLLTDDFCKNLDHLWYTSWFFHQARPGWQAFMQTIHKEQHSGKATVYFLPMIDHNPNDLSCVYSTLLYVSGEAKKQSVTPVITFDQPLYWKAVTIINAEPPSSIIKDTVVLLGGFHTRMSFLGCIGYIMQEAGLAEVLEQIYAGNTVKHIMSGKAVSRAMRAHSIVDQALNIMFTAESYDLSTEELLHAEKQPSDINQVGDLYKGLLVDNTVTFDDVNSSGALHRILEKQHEKKLQLSNSRTAKLWFQYMEMVSILKRFIRAERSGNWYLYLQTLADMLPYFAAAGHTQYTKSARVHLQIMMDLKTLNPDLYTKFENGLFIIRRSDRLWAGLAPDLVIEQALMRSLKTTGGLTRGRGMTDTQRSIWLLSMPICAQINESMQELTGLTYSTNEQHVEASQSRIQKDTSDTQTIISYLTPLDPFCEAHELRNIVTGVTASTGVTVDTAKDVGLSVLMDMTGKAAEAYIFRKRDKAVNMGSKTAVQIDGDDVHFDQSLLFQRLAIVASRECPDMEEIMSYELCTHPPSLFKSFQVFRKANKPSLAAAIWKTAKAEESIECVPNQCMYVIDGGWLLQQIPWQLGTTYDTICSDYVAYVYKHFGKASVVFDGYSSGPSTKDLTHQQRTKGLQCPTIEFSGSMKLTKKKDIFLLNSINKERMISFVGQKLTLEGCLVSYASGDADVLIVTTALSKAEFHDVCIIGNDTDLLILLLFYCQANTRPLYFKTETKVWHINNIKHQLGSICDKILFIHAFLGCDTTSTIYGVGKQVALSLALSDKQFQQASVPFCNPGASKEDLIAAGEIALLRVYKGRLTESLISLRHRLFVAKVGRSSTFVEPQRLPPTRAAAQFHYFRVYLQIMEWQGVSGMKPEEWGWHLAGGIYVPTMTDKKPAPPQLLSIIRCNCSTGCVTARCSCRKHELPCTLSCGECMGSCSNCEWIEDSEDRD